MTYSNSAAPPYLDRSLENKILTSTYWDISPSPVRKKPIHISEVWTSSIWSVENQRTFRGNGSPLTLGLKNKAARTPTTWRQASRHETKDAVLLRSWFRLESVHRLRQDKHQDMRQKTQSCFVRDSDSSPHTNCVKTSIKTWGKRRSLASFVIQTRVRTPTASRQASRHEKKTQSCFIRDSDSSPHTEVARVCVLSHLL
jgi:hypothetical protein